MVEEEEEVSDMRQGSMPGGKAKQAQEAGARGKRRCLLPFDRNVTEEGRDRAVSWSFQDACVAAEEWSRTDFSRQRNTTAEADRIMSEAASRAPGGVVQQEEQQHERSTFSASQVPVVEGGGGALEGRVEERAFARISARETACQTNREGREARITRISQDDGHQQMRGCACRARLWTKMERRRRRRREKGGEGGKGGREGG